MLYRICTEDKNRDHIRTFIPKWVEGYTMFSSQGEWRGKIEQSLTIEIAVNDTILERSPSFVKTIEQFARDIKKLNNQEAVLLETIPCLTKLIY